GKKRARGDVRIPTWLTIACGIGGVLLGNFFYTLLFKDNTPGFDWWRHTWQVVVPAVLVSAAARPAGGPLAAGPGQPGGLLPRAPSRPALTPLAGRGRRAAPVTRPRSSPGLVTGL